MTDAGITLILTPTFHPYVEHRTLGLTGEEVAQASDNGLRTLAPHIFTHVSHTHARTP